MVEIHYYSYTGDKTYRVTGFIDYFKHKLKKNKTIDIVEFMELKRIYFYIDRKSSRVIFDNNKLEEYMKYGYKYGWKLDNFDFDKDIKYINLNNDENFVGESYDIEIKDPVIIDEESE